MQISCFSLPYLLILNIGRLTPKYWQHVGRSWAAATPYLLEHVEMLSVSRGFISGKKNVTDVRKLFSVKNSMTNPLHNRFSASGVAIRCQGGWNSMNTHRAHNATLNVDQHIGNETAETAALGRLPPIYWQHVWCCLPPYLLEQYVPLMYTAL